MDLDQFFNFTEEDNCFSSTSDSHSLDPYPFLILAIALGGILLGIVISVFLY